MRISFNPAQFSLKQNNFINFRAKGASLNNVGNPVNEQADAYLSRKERYLAEQNEYSIDAKTRQSKIGVTEYDRMDFWNKEYLQKNITVEIADAAEVNAHLGFKLKNSLDKKYGRDEYIFISVGVPASLIGKAVESAGAEVRYIPVPQEKGWMYSFSDKDYKLFGNFLRKQEISKQAMDSSSKKYLFYDCSNDYKQTQRLEDMLVTKYNLPKEKMEFRNLSEDLRGLRADSGLIEGYIKDYLQQRQRREKFTSISHLPCRNLKPENFEPWNITRHHEMPVKLFNFLVMSKLNEIGRLENNPRNDVTL